MPLTIIRNDITKLKVDVIVNAANTNLQEGGGVCGAIFHAAGADKLQAVCDSLAPIQIGEAVITPGFDLPAKYIIHVAGPIYRDGKQNEEALLRLCYENTLNLAKKNGCESIAFPLISSGTYGYPKDEALAVATSVISDWLMNNEMDVLLVVFDKASFALSQELLGEIKTFIDENYIDNVMKDERSKRIESLAANASLKSSKRGTEKICSCGSIMPQSAKFCEKCGNFLADIKMDATEAVFQRPIEQENAPKQSTFFVFEKLTERLDEPFSTTLLRLIDSKGKTDVEIYKRANLDRKLFSKIRTGNGYMPSKKTVIALAVALELSLTETRDLLGRAGFALSRSVMFDVIIEYFIIHKRYNIYEINNVLFQYDQPLLGG